MHYSPEDLAWIRNKAAEYADQSGYADSMAMSLAMAEFRRLQERPKAPVTPLNGARQKSDEDRFPRT